MFAYLKAHGVEVLVAIALVSFLVGLALSVQKSQSMRHSCGRHCYVEGCETPGTHILKVHACEEHVNGSR